MVKDSLWSRYKRLIPVVERNGRAQQTICQTCFEQLRGKKLTDDDFNFAPCNVEHMRTSEGYLNMIWGCWEMGCFDHDIYEEWDRYVTSFRWNEKQIMRDVDRWFEYTAFLCQSSGPDLGFTDIT
jgi:hypothetical protein